MKERIKRLIQKLIGKEPIIITITEYEDEEDFFPYFWQN